MDEQFRERAEAFETAYRALVQQYGVELVPQVQSRQLGPVIQTEAILLAQPIRDWTEPDPIPDPLAELQKEIEVLREQLAAAEARGHSPNGRPILTEQEIDRALHPANGQQP